MSALAMRRGWCPGARRPMETGDGLLVRVHPPGGVLSTAQARALADAAEACGNGLLDVTARGNLQLRGVSDETHPAVLDRLSAIGLLEDEAAEGPYRLTLTSPLAGIDPDARFDAAALAAAIEKAAKQYPLPAKLYVSVDAGGALRPEPGADVRIAPAGDGVAIGLAAGERYVWHGPVPLADAVDATTKILAAFARIRGSTRRMRDVPPEALEAIAAFSFPVGEGKGRAGAAGFLAGCALLLALPFGRATAAQLRVAAGWAEVHARGEIRLSFTRGVLIPHLSRDAAGEIAREADAMGFVTDPADPRLALVACPGAPACGRGHTPAPRDAVALADAARGLAATGATIHLSACPKGCAHPRAADLTLVGRPDGRYDVIPGGAAGGEPAAALTLPEIAAILRQTPDPSGFPAAFRGPDA